jgi:hypothetical protein
MITRRSVRRALGLAAFLAAARVAWWHHMDNQLVILTDAVRDAGRTAFAAGQAAERNRRTEEERTARVWTGWSGPPMEPFVTGAGRLGPSIDGGPVVGVRLGPGGAVEWVTERDGRLDEFVEPEEPEGPGWTEHHDRYGGTSR